MQNFSTHYFGKPPFCDLTLNSLAAVVQSEKTSLTSKRDSWSQLKCNLSNPVILRSKGFPLSAFSLCCLCCGRVWAPAFVHVCTCLFACVGVT